MFGSATLIKLHDATYRTIGMTYNPNNEIITYPMIDPAGISPASPGETSTLAASVSSTRLVSGI